MKPRYTSTIIEKTEKAKLVRFEFKGKVFYKVFYNIRPNDGTGLPGYSTMCDCKEGFGDDEGAARAFFEEKKNGEPAAEEAKAEEKKETDTARFNEKQIEALEKQSKSKEQQLTKAKEIIEELSKSLFLAKGIIRDLIDDTVDFKESKKDD